MDPVTAIGVASAVITFVEFAARLISGAMEVYESADGSMRRDTHTKQISYDFDNLSQKLQELTIHPSPLSEDEQELRKIAEQSRKTCGELHGILMGLTAGGKSKWSSIKTAWKSRRMEDDVQVLYNRLRDYRSEIVLRLNKMQLDGNTQLQKELALLRKTVQESIRTDEEMEACIRGRIMDQLSFEAMSSRKENISEPETGTLNWIVDSPKDYEAQASHDVPENFILQQREARDEARNRYMSWLKGDEPAAVPLSSSAPTSTPASSLLFIAGKAGSGKSTLMHRLFEHAQSHPDTLAWANNRKPVFVSFYFWLASNEKLQMTMQGLYRSVLYSVVDQCPDLAPVLFPDQWQAIHDRIHQKIDDPSGKLDAARFDGKALRVAFERILDNASTLARRHCFCLFLDGLDEYRATANYGRKIIQNAQESGREIARDVLQWGKAEHIRICCSARPHAEFELLLSKATTLILENANLCDIYRYCKQTFEKNDDFGNFGARGHSLAYTLASRSEGVFLWALLAVKILVPALERGASDAELETKLMAVPDEIDALYDELLGQVDSTDRERSNQVLILALKQRDVPNSRGLPAYCVLWIDEVLDANKPIGDSPENYGDRRVEICQRKARLKINHLTRGILELSNARLPHEQHPHQLPPLMSHFSYPPLAHAPPEPAAQPRPRLPEDPTIEFFHRTAYNYVQERYTNGRLRSDALDFRDNSIFARLQIADYVHIYHGVSLTAKWDPGLYLSWVLNHIFNYDGAEDVRHRSLTFLADSIALGIRQRRHPFPKQFPILVPDAFLFTFSSYRRSTTYDIENKDRTPILEGPNIGYTFTLAVCADIEHNANHELRFYLCLDGSDLFRAILSQTPHRTATDLLRSSQDKKSFFSFLSGKAKSGLPYPPWMFLTAYMINFEIDRFLYKGRKHDLLEHDIFNRKIIPSKILLPEIIPPEARHDAVITLSKQGASLLPALGEMLTVRVDENEYTADVRNADSKVAPSFEKSVHPHVKSIDYQGHRVDGDTEFLITCR